MTTAGGAVYLPRNRQILKPQPPQRGRVVRVTAVKDDRRFEPGFQVVKVGAAELSPFGHDDQRVGINQGGGLVGGVMQAAMLEHVVWHKGPDYFWASPYRRRGRCMAR